MTSSFSNMVIGGQCIANLDDMDRYGDILASLKVMGSKFLYDAVEIASSIAGMNFSKACFVGIGPLAAVANESASEVARTHSRQDSHHVGIGIGVSARSHVGAG